MFAIAYSPSMDTAQSMTRDQIPVKDGQISERNRVSLSGMHTLCQLSWSDLGTDAVSPFPFYRFP